MVWFYVSRVQLFLSAGKSQPKKARAMSPRVFRLARRMTMTGSICFAKYFNPFKSKDLTNPFAESDSQTLRAGFKFCPLQIVSSRLGRRFAEYRQ
jgi:hypothetical protein